MILRLIIPLLPLFIGVCVASIDDDARSFVNEAEAKLMKEAEIATFASWNYESNIKEETKKINLAAQLKFDTMTKEVGKKAMNYDMDQISDPDLKRKLKMLRDIGTAVLDKDDLMSFTELKSNMGEIYSTAKVLDYKEKKNEFSLEPELTKVFSKSRDHKELQYYWEQWRKETGTKMRDMYKTYVDYYNKAAKLNGYRDASLMKVSSYESDTFMEEMESTWQGLKPLYQQLHAYVRTKLNKEYGDEVVPKSGPLPAHLLGNMWGQSWGNLVDILRPYPKKPSLDVTEEMVKQGWTPTKMFQKADEFFQSIGLDPMPSEFWSESVLEKPDDGRELVCHASAWDFYNGKDFRIKQCTAVNQEDYVTVNHEMGHIQYYLQYKNQSYLYRNGANPGFHEGVADILSLAVRTATYFKRLGLIGEELDVTDTETEINVLLEMALDRIAFLPFGYLIDRYRWDIFSGKASKEDMNCHWWKLRHEIQGLRPPSKRNNNQFDPGAKYHVAGDVGYVRYFTAFIYEFQFYRALCLESGQYVPNDPEKPLHRCNFYGSKAAGTKLGEMLKLGSSKPWKEAMNVITGQPEMSTDALREYFAPLETWLKKENEKNGVEVDWGQYDMKVACQQGEVKKGRKGDEASSASVTGVFTGLVTLQLVVILLNNW